MQQHYNKRRTTINRIGNTNARLRSQFCNAEGVTGAEAGSQPTGEAERGYVWTSSGQNLAAPKNSGLMTEQRGGQMEQRDKQSMGLDILRPDDRTLWKRALKSKPGPSTNEKALFSTLVLGLGF